MSSPWYTVAGITTGDNSDCYAVLQGLLDDIAGRAVEASGSRTVAIPSGDATISHPVVISSPSTAVVGDPSGGSRLKPTDWQGPALVVRKPRSNIPTGTSLATGAGAAFRFGTTENGLDLGGVSALGNLGLLSALTVGGFIDPNDIASRELSPVVGCGYDYGVSFRRTAFCVLGDGSLRVYWADSTNASHDTAPGLIADDTTYYFEWSFDGTLGTPTVTLWLGIPGGTAAAALQFAVADTTFPQLPGGAEPWALGYMPDGMGGGPQGEERTADMWYDAFQWSDTVRHSSPFTCPTVKPDPDSHTILVLNGVTNDPFVMGSLKFDGGKSRDQFILPLQGDGDANTLGGVTVRDLAVLGGAVFHHVISADISKLNVDSCWRGLHLAGVCFGAQVVGLAGACGSCGLLVSRQVSCSNWRVNVRAGGFPVFMYGAVGGVLSGVVGMTDTQFGTLYVNGTNAVKLDSFQVDDETFGSVIPHSVICHAARLTVSGGLFPRVAPGPVFECVGGGSVSVVGATLQAYGSIGDAVGEIVKFYGPPIQNAVVLGCPTLAPSISYPVVPDVTKTPHWCLYDQYGVLHVPQYDRG